MKDVIVKNLKEDRRPTIDRSSKQSAVKQLEQRELLAEKAKQSTLNNFEAENKYVRADES